MKKNSILARAIKNSGVKINLENQEQPMKTYGQVLKEKNAATDYYSVNENVKRNELGESTLTLEDRNGDTFKIGHFRVGNKLRIFESEYERTLYFDKLVDDCLDKLSSVFKEGEV